LTLSQRVSQLPALLSLKNEIHSTQLNSTRTRCDAEAINIFKSLNTRLVSHDFLIRFMAYHLTLHSANRGDAKTLSIDKYDDLPSKVSFPSASMLDEEREMIKCVPHEITQIFHEDLSLISR
jgi:hypothetical protein